MTPVSREDRKKIVFKTQVIISRQSTLGSSAKMIAPSLFLFDTQHSDKKCWKPLNHLVGNIWWNRLQSILKSSSTLRVCVLNTIKFHEKRIQLRLIYNHFLNSCAIWQYHSPLWHVHSFVYERLNWRDRIIRYSYLSFCAKLASISLVAFSVNIVASKKYLR